MSDEARIHAQDVSAFFFASLTCLLNRATVRASCIKWRTSLTLLYKMATVYIHISLKGHVVHSSIETMMLGMSAVKLVWLFFFNVFSFLYTHHAINPPPAPLPPHTQNNSDCYVMYKQEYQSSVSWFIGMLQIRQRSLLPSRLGSFLFVFAYVITSNWNKIDFDLIVSFGQVFRKTCLYDMSII